MVLRTLLVLVFCDYLLLDFLFLDTSILFNMFGLGHLDTMARSNNPTIVIAGGAWQPSSGYNLLVAKLCSQGYTTIAPSLPSIGGTTTPLPGLAEDVQAIRTVLKNLVDEGKDVILLCHSYGGVVGSCAVEGLDTATRKKNVLPGGVSKVIYMSAFMLPKGKSLVEMLGGQPLPWMEIQVRSRFILHLESRLTTSTG